MKVLNNLVLDSDPEVSFSVMPGWFTPDRHNTMAGSIAVVRMEFVPELSASAKQFISKLNSYRVLEPDWDSYGADVPSDESIDQAIGLIKKADRNALPVYFVAPGPNGELVIEFKKGKKEAAVYINPDRSTELVVRQGDNYLLEGTLEENYSDLLSLINQ